MPCPSFRTFYVLKYSSRMHAGENERYLADTCLPPICGWMLRRICWLSGRRYSTGLHFASGGVCVCTIFARVLVKGYRRRIFGDGGSIGHIVGKVRAYDGQEGGGVWDCIDARRIIQWLYPPELPPSGVDAMDSTSP